MMSSDIIFWEKCPFYLQKFWDKIRRQKFQNSIKFLKMTLLNI